MRADVDNRSRILGCILGGALGDAWGGPWEGNPGRVAFQIPSRSSVSDDTQLTLATCESIIESGGVHPERLASNFATWFATGRVTGIGASTLKAMRDLVAGVHWALAGSRGEYSAGTGAANSLFVSVADSVPDSAVRDRIKQFLSLKVPPSEVASQFGASGWVVDTVPLALYCAQFIAEKPLSVVLAQAIEVGGDTDTIASIAGQIAGTASGFPPDYAGHFSRIIGGNEI